jgi:hypothetical protein
LPLRPPPHALRYDAFVIDICNTSFTWELQAVFLVPSEGPQIDQDDTDEEWQAKSGRNYARGGVGWDKQAQKSAKVWANPFDKYQFPRTDPSPDED